MSEETPTDPVALATEITIAWLSNSNNRVSAEDVPGFLRTVHAAVTELSAGPVQMTDAAPAAEFTPAVSVRRSLASKDHILSLIDGKPYKTLTRHLSRHGLTPDQYRERYGLKPDYPMIAQSYSERRSELARSIGLGRRSAASKDGAASQVANTKPTVRKSRSTLKVVTR